MIADSISFRGHDCFKKEWAGFNSIKPVNVIIVRNVTHNLSNSVFRRLLADRDIRSEVPDNAMTLSPDGAGATNIIRRYIVTSNPRFPREIIQKNLLTALNEIFGQDGQFSEIQVKFHDEAAAGTSHG